MLYVIALIGCISEAFILLASDCQGIAVYRSADFGGYSTCRVSANDIISNYE